MAPLEVIIYHNNSKGLKGINDTNFGALFILLLVNCRQLSSAD